MKEFDPNYVDSSLNTRQPEPPKEEISSVSFSKRAASETWELAKIVIGSLLIVLPIRLFIAQPFIVRGASMEPNFHEGQYLIIDEASYYLREPQRGEVVVFRYPQDTSQFFIKRVIGLPGEEVEIAGGKVKIINDEHPVGFVLEEKYLPKNIATTPDQQVFLGTEEYFVMGDNRVFSSDSRRWGTLEEKYLIGRALVRLWPLADIGVVKKPNL